ncbi:MAG TPA: helix-turn-helix transcriptional regulator [Nocardioides sp.]|nr:helix-turn-helix transcriptional regulator [Nocardioides sp.]
MARRNANRSIGSERALARRVAWEREKRGWSYEGLASRMTLEGCPIQASALFKIEKSDPPRRITVDELVALARVMNTTPDELLRPVEVVLHDEIRELADQDDAAWEQLFKAIDRATDSRRSIVSLYKRAQDEGNEELSAAIDSWHAADRQEIGEGKRRQGGGLAAKLAAVTSENEKRRAAMTPAERLAEDREREFVRRIEDATDALMDAIYDVADLAAWDRTGVMED